MSDGPDVSREDISAALHRVLASAEFSGADRLRAFLTYIVQEHLAGRASNILGKTILEDVYNVVPDAAVNRETVVRVDATRLRRRLDAYYASEGADDPVRIHVDKGGYAPRFDRLTPKPVAREHPPKSPLGPGYLRIAAVGAVLGLGAAAIISVFPRSSAPPAPQELSPAGRSALFEEAPTSLIARNTAEEARDLLFPATQIIRVSAALEMFEEAIALDPDYFGAHAGASQASSILAVLSPEAEDRRAWSQSAAAFAAFIGRDYEAANRLSLKAVGLEPANRHALEIDAIIALFSGDFDRAIRSADPNIHQGRGFPWRNALGNAYFHAGDYAQSVRFLNEAVNSGEPVSEINTAHLIAAHQASGATEKAGEQVGAFEASWPDSRLGPLLERIFLKPEDALRVIDQMEAAGWEDTTEYVETLR